MMALQQQRVAGAQRPQLASRTRVVKANALFRSKTVVVEEPVTTKGAKGKAKAAEPEPKRKQPSGLSQALNAFDFTSTRSAKDADLLYEAKYGQRGEDGKMTPEQYQALRRKVIGTAKDYWKDWVEEEQVKNVKTYYKPDDAGGTVPYLPLLVGVVVLMLATTVYVVAQTS
ncbi:hypothetical protein HYH02_013259 [Chlamydomonas schloesseri]|uniref:Uncharacterized protein n=1 Tax=Chlamydomonas schloesseri TaxID=2026947 RepID=A0A835VW84_9CHLO|nr:hypothetical protein HYH02_013259 [Chlamydomonas schloesseri]|eukprot:KAG2431682.1 hypothetical protein HYH02_013259 [Chlamydomonas schloesseri]